MDRNIRVMSGLENLVDFILMSAFGKEQIEERAKVAGQPKLALMRIKTIEVSLPLLAEQHYLVTYLDSVKAKVQELRRVQEETQREIEAMTASVLDKALRGRCKKRFDYKK